MVIDLGTDWEPREAPPGSLWRVRRRTGLVVGLLVCLLLVGVAAGSAAPVPAFRLVNVIPARYGDFFFLSGDRVFITHATTPARRSRVDAYELPGGRHLWQALLPAQVYAFPAAAPLRVVLAEGASPQQPQQVTALDATTGKVLWRLADAVVYQDAQDAGPRLLVLIGPSGQPGQLRLLDTRSGATLWSRPLPTGTRANVVDRRRVVLRAPDGTAQVLDEDTGRLLVSRRLETTSYTSPLDESHGFSAGTFSAGDRLIVTYPLPHDATGVAAYQMSTLDKLWSIVIGEPVVNVADCAAVLCISGENGMTTVDPATGERRWTTQQWMMGGAQSGLIQAASAPSPRSPQGGVVLLDPATGRLRLDLSDWSPLEPVTPGLPGLFTTGRRGPLGVWIGELNRQGTAVRPVAFLPEGVRDTCAADRTDRLYLACADYDGPIDIWVARPAVRG